MLKNLLFTSLCLFLTVGLFAQNQKEVDIAKSRLVQDAEKYGLNADEIPNYVVSDHYVTKHNGASHLYLWQTHEGVKVYNGIITVGLKNDKIYNLVSSAVKNIDEKIVNSELSLTPEAAIAAAGAQLGFPNNEPFSLIQTKGENNFVYAATSFASNNIPVYLCYDRTEDGNYTLAWNVDLDIPGSNYWSVRIDAKTAKILTKNNYTVHCQYDHDVTHSHDLTCKSSFAHKVETNSTNATLANSMMMEGTYRVYEAPAESPNHGDHELVTNPADPMASPFGWHDTDGEAGAEYTITRGNNVHAYLDKDVDNNSDGMEPDGGEDLIFDFAHDQAAEPEVSELAAQVNLFYFNNFLHDFLWRHGFDEASGNFQENNYGNGGLGGDYVFAESADGSGTNNANFATPPDGGSGRMQMFLWGASEFDLLTVNDPVELAGKYEVRAAGFGAAITDDPVTGNLVFVADDSADPTQGCFDLTNGDDINGNIAVIDRGSCEFGLKCLNAQNQGAIAAIVCNIPGVNGGDGSEIFAMGAGAVGADVDIPAIMVTFQDCQDLRASIDAGIPVNATIQLPQVVGPTNLDASFDNGVIAHELGHGVSNRLTGGPSQAGCLGNDEQMGEGWSDYFALVTTVEPGDQGTDGRGIGTYVTSESVDGGGIRTQRYSTDPGINNKVYDDIIGTTAPHPLGEVWAAITWDIYWAMVDKYGYDADVTNQESGNARAIRLVIDGMREQGCSPGFVSGRDGILKADTLNNEADNACMLWEIFAKRGVGINALENSTNDRNDGVQDFEPWPFCIEELKIEKTATEIVKGGGEIEFTIVVKNHVPNTLAGVVVTDEIPTGTSFIDGSSNISATVAGNTVTWDLGDMEYKEEIIITYKSLAEEATLSEVFFLDDMENGDGNWDIEINEGTTAFWEISTEAAASGQEAWFIPNSEEETDNELFLIDYFEVQGDRPTLAFNHQYTTETGSDGGFVAVQEEGQIGWTRLSFDNNVLNGFNTTLAYGTFALPNLATFSGTTNEEFVSTYLDLSDYIGKNIRIQFRFGTDANTAPVALFNGWAIDDVSIIDLKDYAGTACATAESGENACATATTLIDSEVVVNNKETEADDYSMSIFPNPASNVVNIQFTASEKENAVLSIFSVDGTLISSQNMTLNQGKELVSIPVNNLPSGFYVVQLRGEKNTSIKRLMID